MYACFLKDVESCKKRLDSSSRLPVLRLFLKPLQACVDHHVEYQESYDDFNNRILVYLCDVQIITSLAILIAGLILLFRGTLSFYHQQFISNFWNQAINSYWAARDAKQDDVADRGLLQFKVRISALLASIILATVFQSKIFWREAHSWDQKISGRCYLTRDHSAKGVPILWLVGFGFYIIYLALYLRECTNEWMLQRLESADRAIQHLCIIPEGRMTKSRVLSLARQFADLLRYSCNAFWRLLKHFLSFFCLGDNRHIPEVLAFIGLSAWNTYDIIDLKLSNKSLLKGSEMGWGFGQILQPCLLGMMMFVIFDCVKR